MNIKNRISTDKTIFTIPIKYFFYKTNNKYYDVNKLIKETSISDNLIKITLYDNTILKYIATGIDAEIQFTDRIKYGNKEKLDKILNVEKFYFIYETISELFVNSFHFKYFDINEGDIVIDAGANIGGFTVQAGKKVGKNGKVIAIEPDPNNMKILKLNCEANNLGNVIFVEKGLWSKKDKLEFYESHRPGEHSLIHTNEQHEKIIKKSKIIDVDTFDNILYDNNIKKVDFVKVDIEGAEYEALLGSLNTLMVYDKIKFVIEIHYCGAETTDKMIIPFLSSKGFKVIESGSSYRMPVFASK